MQFQTKRIYEEPSEDDGTRVLVDRLWPRGMSRERARVDRWLRDISPSTELRKRFGHAPDKWSEFRRRYFEELHGNPEAVSELLELAADGRVTLLFAAKDEQRNNAVALKAYLDKSIARRR